MVPTFTIAIPVYERLFGFEEALQSAIAVKECSEILVSDNHSSHDAFRAICAAMNDPRIRYIKQERNLGLYQNYNCCAQRAKGTFLAILGSDDVIAADCFQRFLKAYAVDSSIDVFFGPFTIFYTDVKKFIVERRYPLGKLTTRCFLEDAVEKQIKFPQLSIIRTAKLQASPFIAEPKGGNDWLWIYSNASSLNLYSVDEPLSYWRQHQQQDSGNSPSIMDAFPLVYLTIAEQLKVLQSPKASKAYRRAESVVLNWFINDKSPDDYWRKRLQGSESGNNLFLAQAKAVINKSWLLSKLLYSGKTRPFYYQLGRTLRKVKIYESQF